LSVAETNGICSVGRAHAADMRVSGFWSSVGHWLLAHQRAIRMLQWAMVAVYLVLLVGPAALPFPDHTERLWNNAVLFSQFVFWGIWWPFVLLSMLVVGRAWCGLLCPEGSLSEFASRHGRARATPRWITWGGWPFLAFLATTIYGQMVSVYQYPSAALVLLGGSTLAAIVVGAAYGRSKRVWCRYLCPVSGVFGLLAKLAPLHFAVETEAWRASQRMPKQRLAAINCAPLVPIRTMRGASLCHMCGRCDGFRGAVSLAPRSPNREIIDVAGATANPWETALIIFGMIGAAMGAFHWSISSAFVAVKQHIARVLVEHGIMWPLDATLPWWMLTNYPAQNDVLSVLDGGLLITYILITGAVLGSAICGFLALATRAIGRWSWARFHHLAQCLIPIAGCGVFLGLSALTVNMLRHEGLSFDWVGAARMLLLASACAWSLWLAACVSRRYVRSRAGAVLPTLAVGGAVATAATGPALMFWFW
jgi:polyferredoxin